MFCSNCGKKNEDNAVFCYGCGQRLKQEKTETKKDGPLNNASPIQEPTASEKLDGVVERVYVSVHKLSDKVDKKFKNQKKVKFDENNINASVNDLKPLTLSSNIDTNAVKRESYNHPYTKLGGFLAFIYYGGLVSEVISFIALIISTISLCGLLPYAPQYVIVILLAIPFAVISMILAFILLVKIKHKDVDFLHYFIKIAIITGLFLALPLQIIQFVIQISIVTAGVSSQYLAPYMGDIISAAILGIVIYLVVYFVVVWLFVLYFVKSERVRTYMGTDAYAKISPFTRKMQVAKPATTNSEASPKSVNVCKHCGAKLKDGNKFCTNCGKSIN